MIGLPNLLKTKQDWINALDYAKSTGDGKAVMKKRLLELKDNETILVLKASAAGKDPEELTQVDFEAVPDPACEKLRLGFTDTEIEELIGGLE
jgi:hypothetical protein